MKYNKYCQNIFETRKIFLLLEIVNFKPHVNPVQKQYSDALETLDIPNYCKARAVVYN